MKIYVYLILLFLSINLYANPILTSASSVAIGENSSLYDRLGALNIAPALLAQQKMGMQLTLSRHTFQFSTMDNIVVKSPLNDNRDDNKKEDFKIDYPHVSLLDLSLQIPFLGFPQTSMAFHFSGPVDNLMMINTLDPYLPEYYPYSQYNKPNLSLYFIREFKEFNFSLGVITGMTAIGETKVLAKTQGDPDGGSSGKLEFQTKPKNTFLISFARQTKKHSTFLTYQHDQKSDFINRAEGLTPAGGDVKYNFDLSSAIYYSPKIVRLGFENHFDSWSYYTQIRYEDWSTFESPILQIDRNSGVIESSEDFYDIKTQNILVPSLGAEITHQKFISRYGIMYRPSIFKNTQNGNSNLLDTDKIISSLGIAYPVKFFQNPFLVNFSAQYIDLVEKNVQKSNGREDNKAGEKIGSDGYKFDGNIYSLYIGLSWNVI
jgi:hypothetical protein